MTNPGPNLDTSRSPFREDLCSAIVEQAPLPMAMVAGASHTVRYANRAFRDLVGNAAGEIVGKTLRQILPEKDECLAMLDRVRRTGRPETRREQPHAVDRAAFASLAAWPVMAGDQSTGIMLQVIEAGPLQEKTLAMNEALVLGSLRQHELTAAADRANTLLHLEIGERKLAEAALDQARVQLSAHAGELEGLVTERTLELAATNQQLEAFVYSIAHDLRAPLRSMQGFSELLVEEAGAILSKTGRSYADYINKSAQFMDALLSDLLAFSRISQQHVELVPVELHAVVESTLLRLKKEVLEKNARVEWPGPWPVVMAHEPTLAQVLFNLVDNALKFAVPDVSPVVRLRTEKQGEFIRVWVEDNGIGIAPEYQDQVFRVFSRIQGEKFEGTGIGLAIVQKGVERMNGRVGVESVSGLGCHFWFELREFSPEII